MLCQPSTPWGLNPMDHLDRRPPVLLWHVTAEPPHTFPVISIILSPVQEDPRTIIMALPTTPVHDIPFRKRMQSRMLVLRTIAYLVYGTSSAITRMLQTVPGEMCHVIRQNLSAPPIPAAICW